MEIGTIDKRVVVLAWEHADILSCVRSLTIAPIAVHRTYGISASAQCERRRFSGSTASLEARQTWALNTFTGTTQGAHRRAATPLGVEHTAQNREHAVTISVSEGAKVRQYGIRRARTAYDWCRGRDSNPHSLPGSGF